MLRFTLTLMCGLLAFGQTDLQILRATYGDGNTVRDVTSHVAAKLQNSTLRIQAMPDVLGGDPVPGAVKTLWVQYNFRGQTGEVSAQDGAWIILPTTGRLTVPDIFRGGNRRGNTQQQQQQQGQLIINSAQYGADPKWVDVKSTLDARIQNNALNMQVNNSNFGGDPIMGKQKTLRVNYSYRGQNYDVAVPENGTLNISDSQMGTGVPSRPVIFGRGNNNNNSQLVILSAEYGAPAQPNSNDQASRRDRFNDVKGRLDSMIQNNTLRVVVNNANLGMDPAPANKKMLRVSYQWQGQTFQASADENGTLTIPDAAAAAQINSNYPQTNYPAATTTTNSSSGGFFGGLSQVSGLRILSATYGSGNRVIDVTNMLNSRVQNNSLSLSVNNETMGRDPAVGADKVLQVTYELNGNRQQVSVNEGKSLRIQ